MVKPPAKPPTTIEEVDLDVLENTLSFYIRTVNLAVSRDLDECLEGLDVAKGTGKITTLLLVDSHPGIRPSVIAQLTMKDRSAMGRIVDQMVAHGLIRRETSLEDTRAQELYITDAGAALAAKVRELVTKQSKDFFALIPQDEQRQLMDILRRAYRRIVGTSTGASATERRVALISGAGRGIGAIVAAELARQGWALSLGMRNPEMPAWADTDTVHLQPYDANEPGAEARWVANALDRFGRIDAIIANAGIMIPKTVIDAEDEDLDAMLAVNVKAPRRLAKAAWGPLSECGRGRVIIIGSLSGKRVKSANSGLYAMSKFAAVALAHAIRQTGFDLGIRATAVCPGFVATNMAAGITDRPAELMTDPADIARVIAMLVDLPNEASVAEFAINCQLEEFF